MPEIWPGGAKNQTESEKNQAVTNPLPAGQGPSPVIQRYLGSDKTRTDSGNQKYAEWSNLLLSRAVRF